MTETNATPEKEAKAVTVKLSKLTEGIGMVFAGVLTMLEALDASSANQLLERFNATEESRITNEDKDNRDRWEAGAFQGICRHPQNLPREVRAGHFQGSDEAGEGAEREQSGGQRP